MNEPQDHNHGDEKDQPYNLGWGLLLDGVFGPNPCLAPKTILPHFSFFYRFAPIAKTVSLMGFDVADEANDIVGNKSADSPGGIHGRDYFAACI